MNLFASDVVEYAGAPTCLVQEGGGRGDWVENRLGVSVRPRAVPVRASCVCADRGLSGREREREGRHQVWYVCESRVLSLVCTCAMTRTKLSTGPPPTRPVKRYEIFSNLHCEISMVLVIESDPASFHPLLVDVSQHAAPKSVNTSCSPLPSHIDSKLVRQMG